MNAMFQAPPVLRLRRFLHQQGIRLRPWASETEILDSFYAQLAQRHADREFWERLKEVCGALAADLQHRQPDSELLRSLNTDVAGLVEDVRRAKLDDKIKGLRLPLLILHSPTDKTVGIENASEIFRTARHPRSFVSLEGSEHLLTGPGQAKRAGRIIGAWADAYLR